ncbi:Pectinesterase inhibitor [Corchorus olitorius]|uniref:Pectinesterase inhibitor n=1 Tax=Corchorus olitorius TaxID=93759 RepID=A0A1R3KX43_9ROSI|nr:Pectinesterase inhibitor [Corchorus olitorius]
MAKPDFLTIFLLLLVLNKSFSLAATAQDGESLISKACRKETDYPDLCISTLEANDVSKKAKSYESLCGAAMVVLKSQLEKAYLFVTESLAKQTNSTPSETNSKTKTQIQGCADGFQHAIRRINDGIAAFDKKNYEEAYYKIDTVFESLDECKVKRLDMFQNLNDVTDAFANVVSTLVEKLVPAFDKY